MSSMALACVVESSLPLTTCTCAPALAATAFAPVLIWLKNSAWRLIGTSPIFGARPWTLQACANIRNARLKETLARLGQEALDPGFACVKLTEGLGMLTAVELGRHFHAIEAHEKSPGQKLTPWQMNRITQYLENLSNYLPDVGDIAELCGISARHLRRLFKETTDQTIYQYSRDIWAAKAKAMLSDTRAPVKEIASRLGFSDASSFSMAFRRATGEPPKVFRQQFRKPRVH